MIVDASVILSAFFPDEQQTQAQTLIRNHVSGRVKLTAPTLLVYEVTNAVLQAVRRGRVDIEEGEAILVAVDGLDIETKLIAWRRMLTLARRYNRSAYDAAYLALAEAEGESFVTGDLRLYNAVHDQLDWVHWLGELQ